MTRWYTVYVSRGNAIRHPTAEHKMKNKKTLIQTSKEYVNGKWRKIEFYQDDKGRVTIKVAK